MSSLLKWQRERDLILTSIENSIWEVYMAENKQIDHIVDEIKSNLTGDFDKDKDYINSKMKEYKEHEYNMEILRELGRLMYSIMPEEVRNQVNEAVNKDLSTFDNAIDNVKKFIHENEIDKAFELAKELVNDYEKNGLEFKNDTENEYFCFGEPIEEILYIQFNDPEKHIRRNPYDYSVLFYLYGSLLIEKGEIQEAQLALLKSKKWNPANAQIMFELAETCKMLGEFEDFYKITRESYKYIHRKKDLGRFYRNLGYYFIEKKEYDTAAGIYIFSKMYDDSDFVNEELAYIFSIAGEFEPTADAFEESVKKYDIPLDISDDLLGITYHLGKKCFEVENYNMAMYYFNIFSEFREDEDVKEKMDKIKNLS